jgi:hypothetical protein
MVVLPKLAKLFELLAQVVVFLLEDVHIFELHFEQLVIAVNLVVVIFRELHLVLGVFLLGLGQLGLQLLDLAGLPVVLVIVVDVELDSLRVNLGLCGLLMLLLDLRNFLISFNGVLDLGLLNVIHLEVFFRNLPVKLSHLLFIEDLQLRQ